MQELNNTQEINAIKEKNLITGLICFDALAKFNRMNVDTISIAREYAVQQEPTPEELIKIAKDRGFKAKIKEMPLEKIQKYPLPAMFALKDGTYGLVLKYFEEKQKLFVLLPKQSNQTQEFTFEQFEEMSSGKFIVMNHKFIDEHVKFGFKWFFVEILKFKQVIVEVLIGSFVIQLFALVTPLFTQVILDKVIVHRSLSTLYVLTVAFLALIIFEFALNIVRKYIFLHTASKLDSKLGAKIFNHLFALPFSYFESRKVGNIVARIRELDGIRNFITTKSISVTVDLFFSFVFVAVMFLYSKMLTFVVLGFVLTIAIIYLLITPELRDRLEKKFQMGANSQSYLVESITGVQTVKSLAIEGSMQKKWEDNLAKYVTSNFSMGVLSNFTGALSTTINRGMTISILFFGVQLVIEGKLTIGQLIAFQMFANQFTGPILRLVGLWNEFQQVLIGVDKIADILNSPVEVQTSKAITLPEVKGDIRIEGLSFKYGVSAPMVLKNINLHVKSGMSVGLVGRSGSGKSTIAKLIQRLYIPTEGTIYIDNVDIRNINPIWLRYSIGVVLQENYLFSGTIKENISMARPDASTETIIRAAQMAGAHEFISQFPDGYETIVGERGSTLSGGQCQRIAIARAIITNPRILVFDEATSALDYESERIIQSNINTIKQGRTMVVIAHRLSTIRSCDMIVVFEKGEIVEIGSHDELIEKKGFYFKMHQQQEMLANCK
ncbi:MAG TPA: type I secretion system permease/ATPase [Candidatus Gastranaerophilales bacterium]|nr:type I secretion system permease/ATPase [Candidatus Gastranaerophilales bacterium]